MGKPFDALVIGAGPAGTAAALYVARSGWRTLVIDQGLADGALGQMRQIIDFPGVGDKPSGEALIKRMRWQAKDAGADIREGTVTGVALGESGRLVMMHDHRGEQQFEAETVVLATGCSDMGEGLPGEVALRGKGVCYSVLRDGYAYKQQSVAIFGKTVKAIEAAVHLARMARDVTFIVPGNRLDAPDPLKEQLQNATNVQVLYSASVKEITGNGTVQGAVVMSGGQEKTVAISAIFLCHHEGRIRAEYLGTTIERGPNGVVLVDEQLATSAPGVFACGDILTGTPQIPLVVAAQGIMVATNIHRRLLAAPARPRG
ncbi:MAG: FAD-dependent oxidoreductase [Deltaproteobacteria bacterium]|nr:FAD-dependent oxidoreductase [Deltaproteobacteria bacterium]